MSLVKFALKACGSEPISGALFSLKVHLKRADAYLEPDIRTAELMHKAGLHSIINEQLDTVKSIVIGRKGNMISETKI